MPSRSSPTTQSDGSRIVNIRRGHSLVIPAKPKWRKFTKAEKAAWALAKFGPKPKDPMKEAKRLLKRLFKRRVRLNRHLIRKLVAKVARDNRLRMAKYGPLRLRERIVPMSTILLGTQRNYTNFVLTSTTQHVRNASFTSGKAVQVERCWDRVHPKSRDPHTGRSFYATGSSLRLIKSRTPWDQLQGVGTWEGRVSGSTRYEYQGGFLPTSFGTQAMTNTDLDSIGLSGPYGPSYGDGSAYGPSAWNKFKPKLSTAGVANLLGESKEFFPMLKTTAKGFAEAWKALKGPRKVDPFNVPESLANQFLNLQFGWMPFVRDLVDIHKTYTNLDKLIAQSRRSNGQWQKRKGTVSRSEATSTVQIGGSVGVTPILTSFFYRLGSGSSVGQTRYYSQENTRIWFEGSFRYWVPSLNRVGPGWDLVNIMRQFGAFPDPSVIYDLTPWSWLVDWHTDVGDVISNATDQLFNNLAAKYAYVMVHKTKRVVNDTVLWMRQPHKDLRLFWYQNLDSKTRTEASPFGFNLSEGDYTLRQIAILSALGITRS